MKKRVYFGFIAGSIFMLSAFAFAMNVTQGKNNSLLMANIEALSINENGDNPCRPAMGFCFNSITGENIEYAVPDSTKFQ